MRKSLSLAVLLLFIFNIFTPPSFAQKLTLEEKIWDPGAKTVAFVFDGEDKSLIEIADLMKGELVKLTQGKYEVKFADDTYGEYDKNVISQKLDELFARKDIDLIIGSGFLTGAAVVEKRSLPKPVILTTIYDVVSFGMPIKGNVSGRKNLTYLATKRKMGHSVELFRRAVRFKKVHVLIDDVHIDLVREAFKRSGYYAEDIVLVSYKKTVPEILASLEKQRAEAVYILPSALFPIEYYDELINGLNEMKVPTFSHLGEEAAERGILAAVVPKFYTKFARRIAINADRVLRGEEAGEIPVYIVIEERFVINARTARQIGVSLPFDLLFNAEILHPYESWGGELSIQRAVEEALKYNLNFRIRDEEIREAQKDHLLRWSEYLPSVGYSLQYDIYDAETAKNSQGLVPKWFLKNRYSLSQLIFSDPAFTDIVNSRMQIEVERLNRQTQVLDITDETSRAYLEYLITKALHKVYTDDLEATRHNLRMAERRFKIGVGGKEEIYRWESEVADRQAQVIRSMSDVRTARIVLNQLMNHPQETPFREENVGLELTRYYVGGTEFKAFVKNDTMLKMFIDFNAEEAIKDSPEIQALAIGVSQQKNVKNTAFRKLFLPEANLEGNLDHRLDKRFYNVNPNNDNPDWTVGIDLSYPLFDQGKRGFDYDKQKATLHRLFFKKELAEQLTELDVRKAVYRMFFSLPNIELSRQAMVSATENYNIMEIKYSKGTASITDLIDAQNEKFIREGRAVIAVYQFLQDLTTFDRAVSRFHFFTSDEEKKKWLKDMRKYFADRGIVVE